MNRQHYIVFGAAGKHDNAVIIGKSETLSGYEMLIVGLKDELKYKAGETIEAADIDRIYTTLYFTGKDSLKAFANAVNNTVKNGRTRKMLKPEDDKEITDNETQLIQETIKTIKNMIKANNLFGDYGEKQHKALSTALKTLIFVEEKGDLEFLKEKPKKYEELVDEYNLQKMIDNGKFFVCSEHKENKEGQKYTETYKIVTSENKIVLIYKSSYYDIYTAENRFSEGQCSCNGCFIAGEKHHCSNEHAIECVKEIVNKLPPNNRPNQTIIDNFIENLSK